MDPFHPTPATLAKVVSALAHADELMGPHGAPEDRDALEALLRDPDVVEWRDAMADRGLVPVARDA